MSEFLVPVVAPAAGDTAPRCRHKLSVSIVIPAYQERETIADVVAGARAAMPGCDIVVIDDGSDDGTCEIAEAAGAYVLRHPYNMGNGAALKTAIRTLSSDFLVIIDGDGQHPTTALPGLVAKLEEYDMVVGARMRESNSSRFRDLGNWVFRSISSYLAEHRIPDLTSGLRAFDRRKALEFIHLYPNGFSFPATSLLAFISAGYRVCFVPVRARRRREGTQSKIMPIRDGYRFLLLILRVCTMINPLKVFVPASVISLLTGILWTIRNVLVLNQFSVAGALFMTVGLNILFFGIVVDQLAAIRLRSRD